MFQYFLGTFFFSRIPFLFSDCWLEILVDRIPRECLLRILLNMLLRFSKEHLSKYELKISSIKIVKIFLAIIQKQQASLFIVCYICQTSLSFFLSLFSKCFIFLFCFLFCFCFDIQVKNIEICIRILIKI